MDLSIHRIPQEIGYKISETKDMQQKALYEAFELVRKMRRLGLETRSWAQKMDLDTKALLKRLTAMNMSNQNGGMASLTEKKMWELACLENQILGGLKNYMSETSELANKLKPLNPPLTTEHIRPFHEAMMSDRRITVEAMDPLTRTVSQLTAYKVELMSYKSESGFSYRPSI